MTLIKSVNNVEIKEAKVVKPLEKKRKSLAIMSSLEYLNSDIGKPREFLIDRLIPQSSIGMLVAPAKTNKTTIAYDIALSVATGKDFDYAMIKIALDFNIDISKYLRVKE